MIGADLQALVNYSEVGYQPMMFHRELAYGLSYGVLGHQELQFLHLRHLDEMLVHV